MSQMKLDLISIGEQLPPEFMSSFINRLSPKTYLRLRRTCSIINDLVEGAVEKNEIRVEAKNRDIELPGRFSAAYCLKFDYKRATFGIEDRTSIFGFHFREIYLEYYGSSMSAIELEELADYTKLLLREMRCDRLYLSAFPPENLVKFLPAIKPLDLEIRDYEIASWRKRKVPGYELAEPELNNLKESEIQRISRLSVRDCKLSYRFNLLDLCHERRHLELWLKESWEDCHPMISQFFQDVYSGVDIGPLERFTVATIQPPSWRPGQPDWEGLSPPLLGNVPFAVLKSPMYQVKYAFNRCSALYYCETSTKRLLLTARAGEGIRTSYIRLDLHIIPFDDYSTFIMDLADRVYRAPIYVNFYEGTLPGAFPIDDSHLYSLLENEHPNQYASILEKYIADLNTHIDLDEYNERKRREEAEDIENDSMENPLDIRDGRSRLRNDSDALEREKGGVEIAEILSYKLTITQLEREEPQQTPDEAQTQYEFGRRAGGIGSSTDRRVTVSTMLLISTFWQDLVMLTQKRSPLPKKEIDIAQITFPVATSSATIKCHGKPPSLWTVIHHLIGTAKPYNHLLVVFCGGNYPEHLASSPLLAHS